MAQRAVLMIGRMTGAFGADDVAWSRLKFRKLRFPMIADSGSTVSKNPFC